MSQNKGFRHFRNMVPQDAETIHQINNKGGVTMAFDAPKHINDLTAEDNVIVAFAFCSSDDNFERAAGRVNADQRLVEGLSIPGDHFQQVLHAPFARDLLGAVLTGLDEEQSRNFRSRVKRTLTRI